MIFSSVLDTQTIDEQQVQSFFSRLTLEKLLYAAVLLVLCAVLIRLILRAADKLFSRSKLDHTIFGFLRTSAKAILIFITIMLVAGTLGVDTTFDFRVKAFVFTDNKRILYCCIYTSANTFVCLTFPQILERIAQCDVITT